MPIFAHPPLKVAIRGPRTNVVAKVSGSLSSMSDTPIHKCLWRVSAKGRHPTILDFSRDPVGVSLHAFMLAILEAETLRSLVAFAQLLVPPNRDKSFISIFDR